MSDAPTADQIVDVVLGLDPLSELPRTGWLLRGVRPCESIADHSYGVALITMLFVDALRAEGQQIDGEKALRMALVHDASEAKTGDVPMPVKIAGADDVFYRLEKEMTEMLLPAQQCAYWEEYTRAETLESRIVKAADKVHLIAKALVYEQQQRGKLDEFWAHPKNFDDRGIPLAKRVFQVLCNRAGKQHPLLGK